MCEKEICTSFTLELSSTEEDQNKHFWYESDGIKELNTELGN